MFLLGLTGSIGMGKSETARLFRRLGVPVYDADEAVRSLYARGGAAVEPIAKVFPAAIKNGAVDRDVLSQIVRSDPSQWQILEHIVHPLTAKAQEAFLHRQEEAGAPLVVLDIPLLFETNAEALMDAVAVASAPEAIQAARVLAREGMTIDKFLAIKQRQLADKEKCARANFVIETGAGLDYANEQVRQILRALSGKEGAVWRQRKKGG